MAIPSWQLNTPIDAVVFDCDGTLSAIEGIDELAIISQVGDIVQRLTAEAMGNTGMSLALYEERLAHVKPTYSQTVAVGNQYINHITPMAADVINILKNLNKSIYIVSGGLYPAVIVLGKFLSIPPENIFAVDVYFNEQGDYIDFERNSPLTIKNGKRCIIQKIKQKHLHIAYIGDGLSDYEVQDLVTRFIGYGGAYYRKQIEDVCIYYLKSLSMAALLPLILTPTEEKKLTPAEKTVFQQGMASIQRKEVTFNLAHVNEDKKKA